MSSLISHWKSNLFDWWAWILFAGDLASLKLSEPDYPHSLLLPATLSALTGAAALPTARQAWFQGKLKPIGLTFETHSLNHYKQESLFLIPIWSLLFISLPQIQREEKLSSLWSCKYQLFFIVVILLGFNVWMAIYLLPDYKQLDSKTYFFSFLVNPDLT